jgi:hypothetical protein
MNEAEKLAVLCQKAAEAWAAMGGLARGEEEKRLWNFRAIDVPPKNLYVAEAVLSCVTVDPAALDAALAKFAAAAADRKDLAYRRES